MGLFKLIGPLRRRWWVVALVVLPITLLTAIFSFTSPQKYDGFFTVQENRGSEGATIYKDYGPMYDAETSNNNLIAMFRTQDLQKAAFRQLYNRDPDDPAVQGQFLDFQDRIKPEFERGTTFVTVHYEANTVKEAADAASVLYESFKNYHLKLNSDLITNQYAFINSQVEQKDKEYREASQKLRDYQTRHTGVNFGAQQGALVQQKAQLEATLNDAIRSKDESIRSARFAENQLRDPAFAQYIKTSTNTMMDQNLSGYRARKADLLNTLAQEKLIKGVNNPDIKTLNAKIEAIDKEIRAIENKSVYVEQGSSRSINPLYEQFRQQQAQSTNNIEVSEIRIRNLREQLADVDARLKQMPIEEQQLAKLMLDQNIIENELKLMKSTLGEARVKLNQAQNPTIKQIGRPSVTIVDKKTKVKTLMAFALSAVLAISLVLLLNQFDSGTYTATQTEKALGYNVIAALPKIKRARLAKDEEGVSALGASYQMLSTNLITANGKLQGPALVVASSESNVGRTTVAANLAVTLARDGARVLLVDGDLRQPNLHRHFNVENRAGLAEILAGTARTEEVVHSTSIKDLLFISAGQPPVNPIKLLRSDSMQKFIDIVSKGTDFLIIDSPAGATFADVNILAQWAKNVILVHEAGATATDAEAQMTERLERMGANIVGVVLNKVRTEDEPGTVNFRRSYEATLDLRSASSQRGALTGAERSLTAGRRGNDDEA